MPPSYGYLLIYYNESFLLLFYIMIRWNIFLCSFFYNFFFILSDLLNAVFFILHYDFFTYFFLLFFLNLICFIWCPYLHFTLWFVDILLYFAVIFFLFAYKSDIESKTERWCILCMREGNSIQILPFVMQTDDVYSVWGRATVYKYYLLSCRQVIYTLHQWRQQCKSVTFYLTDRWGILCMREATVNILPFIVHTGDVYIIYERGQKCNNITLGHVLE